MRDPNHVNVPVYDGNIVAMRLKFTDPLVSKGKCKSYLVATYYDQSTKVISRIRLFAAMLVV